MALLLCFFSLFHPFHPIVVASLYFFTFYIPLRATLSDNVVQNGDHAVLVMWSKMELVLVL